MLFSIQILIRKILKIEFFPAFGKILVLVNVLSIQILIKKVLKIDFSSFWQDFGFGECFLHEVIAEFVLPKKYLPELEKIYSMYFFIFYVCGFFLNS